jgi:hypothetical protein
MAHSGCDRSEEDAYSSAAPDPTFAFVGGLCCPTLDFVFAFWIMITFYTLLTSLFCISYFALFLFCVPHIPRRIRIPLVDSSRGIYMGLTKSMKSLVTKQIKQSLGYNQIISLRHSSVLRRIWLCLVFIRQLF